MLQTQNIGFRISSRLTACVSQICGFSTKVRTLSEINTYVKEKVEAEEMKPRKHPGAFKSPPVRLPEKVVESIKNLVAEIPVKRILLNSAIFSRYLQCRHVPFEENEIVEKKTQFTMEVKEKLGFQEDMISEEQKEHYKKVVEGRVKSLMKMRIYNWTRITYTENTCVLYLFSRAPAEYAVLHRIFREIVRRSPDFKPKSLFDFGSGVGTVTWAAQEFWKTSLKEYYNVDACKHMNDLARDIICGDQQAEKMERKGIYYRQFLPSQHATYDLVVSAYTLFDLPSAAARLDIVVNLWQKTGKFLVIVEQGTNAGFKVVIEARDFLLSKYGSKGESKAKMHTFAPCPHDLTCPRFSFDNTPCNFELQYIVMPVGQRERTKYERYSYVVLQKGEREGDTSQWPRIIRPIISRSKLTICKLCTAAGKLQEVNFTASKHGRVPYKCARGSRWGDLLPMELKDVIVDDKKKEINN